MNTHLTKEQIEDVVKGLKRLEPGYLPEEIFFEICRLSVSAVVEVVPLRKNMEKRCIEVLLIKRGEDDPYWAGKYHTPGTVLRSNDKAGSLSDAFDRVLQGELKGTKIEKGPVFVDYDVINTERGMGLILIHWVEITAEAKVGKWFCVNALPDNIIPIQRDLIHIVVKAYKNRTS